MRAELFDYNLPPHLIAQQPCPERDASRLLVVRRGGVPIAHKHFRDLPSLLTPGDLLVLNDTRVVPAQLLGRRERTGGKWEGLFLGERADGSWEVMGQTRGHLVVGETLLVEGPDTDTLPLELVGRMENGRWLLRPQRPGSTMELLARHGRIPLPPYIRKGHAEESDRERYQTVYARQAGAVAAPTAGLHFTPRLFEELKQRGIDWTHVTLHVGVGTFQPVKVEDVTEHRVQPEWGRLGPETVQAINACKQRGNRVVAVGTTSVRVLETAARAHEPLQSWSGETDLTICPPFSFRVVDALVTNFHLPRSSLLLLVAAFTGLESLHAAYRVAVEQEYRFYSYGDAMLIL